MKISIIIRYFNEMQYLPEVVDSIVNQRGGFAKQFIFVNDNSTDGSSEYVESLIGKYPEDIEIKHIQLKKGEFTYASSLNKSIEQADGEFVLILSPHAPFLNNDCLQALLDNFNDPKVGAAYGRIIPREWADTLSRMKGDAVSPPYKIIKSKENFTLPSDSNNMFVYVNLNGCSLVRRSLYEKFRYHELPSLEDMEFGKQLIEAGYKVVYEPRAPFFHSHNDSIEVIVHRWILVLVAAFLVRFHRLPSRLEIIVGTIPSLTIFLLKAHIRAKRVGEKMRYLAWMPLSWFKALRKAIFNYGSYAVWKEKYLGDIQG